ncbi:uncharacterized protein LOC115766969 [Drosophila novamexicana]|uniref:uncharacterized protein LOC115766969 n=1 Tax=Drosophila novamexicana TaxID=47314 RepID=UPI0011E58BCF|nr:uncharacterized protein LOC115766969 [Drosophila novamexicana]
MLSPTVFREFLLLLCVLQCSDGKRNWVYDPISIDGLSADETKVKVDMRVERVGRHEIGFSGTIDWQYDIDNTTMVEMLIYRSASGSESDYKLLPYAVPKKPFPSAKTPYDEIAYPNLSLCSNIPKIEGDVLLPWPRNLYTFHLCAFSEGVLPEVMVDGFYKIIINLTGEVDWSLTIVIRIRTKLI